MFEILFTIGMGLLVAANVLVLLALMSAMTDRPSGSIWLGWGAAACVGLSLLLSEYFDVDDEWWHFPLWMVVGLCVVVPIIFGSIAFAIALAVAGVQVF